MAAVTVLGLGAMGSRMALALLKSGHDVTVWNRTLEKCRALSDGGATIAATPCDAVAGAQFVISMIRDDEASRSVWLDPVHGALATMPPSSIGIESSTLTKNWVSSLADHFAEAGRHFLDAPVAGSRPQADAGQLIYFVGGDAAVLAEAEPILQTMGGTIHHAGPVGAGTAVKLAVNSLFGIQVAALAEIIGMLDATGTDSARAVEILSSTPVCSAAAKAAAASMMAGAFAPMFPVDLVEKDFGYALATAAAVRQPMPVTQAARQLFVEAQGAGLGDYNLTAVATLYAREFIDA
jgi:3-hydroxyisobutyrate dehydrogenase